MQHLVRYIFTYPKVPGFAKESFDQFFVRADKIILVLLFVQWFIATFITSIEYGTYLYGFFGGALIVLPMLILFRYLKGDVYFRIFAGVSMMLFSLIYIQQYLGRIEMHFDVFIAMAILTLYEDIVPLIAAAVTTILHHIIFNYLQFYEVSLFDMPVMVFNYGCGMDIVLLHGVFVVSEMLVLGYLIRVKIENAITLNETQDEVNKLNQELSYTSFHDLLTGLPNRNYLKEKLEKIKIESEQKNKKFALVFLDLDHFKNINDTLGHDVGDAFLQSVANILKNNMPENSTITRIGGDEFVLIIYDFKENSELLLIIESLLREFRKELFVKGHTLRLSASLGVSLYPDDTTNIKELMKYADIAMYKAKTSGRDNFSFFTQDLNTKVHDEVSIINDMQRAYYDGEFQLYYQPQVDSMAKKIVGAEALLRWKRADGFISPAIFIPFAESTGFILTLGAFVLKEGLSLIKKVADMGYEDLVISLNVSGRQFQNSEFYDLLYQAVQQNAVVPNMLGIEITESIMMTNTVKTLHTLNDIKKLGVHVYVDDFGTGYSSLSYLKKFPIDTLKIDKSFVDDIRKNGDNQAILLNTILAMGKTLGLKVIAEGVETEFQYEYLKSYGCDSIQGYYFAKPMPEAEFMLLLQKGCVE